MEKYILHVMGSANAGGISSVVLNYYKYIDHSNIKFEIAIESSIIGKNGQKLQELGLNSSVEEINPKLNREYSDLEIHLKNQ